MEKATFEAACKAMMTRADALWPDRVIGPVISHQLMWEVVREGERPEIVGSHYLARLVESDGYDDYTVARGSGATEEEAWAALEADVARLENPEG